MKSILFIMRYPLHQKHHLKQKFDGQVQACVNLGYQVYHFGYDQDTVYLIDVNNNAKKAIQKTHFGKSGKYRSTLGFVDLFSAMIKVAKTKSFDYAYMRSKIVNKTAVNAIAKFKEQGCKFIVEIPSYMSKEEVLGFKRKIIISVTKNWGKKITQLADLYTLIGAECGGSYQGRPAINIDNGIDVDSIPMRKHIRQNEIHLLALASMRKWHAYDRLIKGLADYQGDENIIVDMVGGDNDGSLEEWKQLAEDCGLTDKVIFHGPKFGDDLSKMFEICDVGVATLGLHRTGLTQGSVLKTREYMARGLPFIYGYKDPSIDDSFPFALRFPADETPVDFYKIAEWIKNINSISDVSEKMRDYARENMSWEMIFRKIISKVDSL